MKPSQQEQDQTGAADVSFALTFPDAEKAFVAETYAKAKSIIEYGSGGSTMLAAELGKPCLSVESDPKWTRELNKAIQDAHGDNATARAVHVNIGPTKAWGYPQDNAAWSRYWRYPMQIWDQKELTNPDIVLIDGRMRKACFAAVMMSIRQDTLVLFDDYANRKKYQRVEAFVKPEKLVGRMGVFQLKPNMLTSGDFRAVIPWFSDMF